MPESEEEKKKRWAAAAAKSYMTPSMMHALNMSKQQSQNKYTEKFDKTKAKGYTPVASTPELENAKKQSQLVSQKKYKSDFEKNKARFTQVADDPETRRVSRVGKQISNIDYQGKRQSVTKSRKKRENAASSPRLGLRERQEKKEEVERNAEAEVKGSVTGEVSVPLLQDDAADEEVQSLDATQDLNPEDSAPEATVYHETEEENNQHQDFTYEKEEDALTHEDEQHDSANEELNSGHEHYVNDDSYYDNDNHAVQKTDDRDGECPTPTNETQNGEALDEFLQQVGDDVEEMKIAKSDPDDNQHNDDENVGGSSLDDFYANLE